MFLLLLVTTGGNDSVSHVRLKRSSLPQSFRDFEPISNEEIRIHFGLPASDSSRVRNANFGSSNGLPRTPKSFGARFSSPTVSSSPIQPTDPSSTELSDSKIITNPLLQKLFNRKAIPNSFQPNSLSKSISSTEAVRSILQNRATQRPGIGRSQSTLLRDQLIANRQQKQLIEKQEEHQRELEEKQKLFDALLKEKEEKERLLKEALARHESERALAQMKGKEIEEERRTSAMKPEFNEKEKAISATHRAKSAIENKKVTGTEKSSPAVWEAIKVLSKFVERQEADAFEEIIPEDILTAINKLSNFLESEDSGDSTATDEKKTLTSNQERIRKLILQQKLQREQEIENILSSEPVETFMQLEFSPSKSKSSFPARIAIEETPKQGSLSRASTAKQVDAAFSFATLPVF